MTPYEKQKLFDMRCRCKRGGEFHQQDYDFCNKMRRLYPKEYQEISSAVFNATKLFGSGKNAILKIG